MTEKFKSALGLLILLATVGLIFQPLSNHTVHAAFPGQNGKVLFRSAQGNGTVLAVDPDGNNLITVSTEDDATQLTYSPYGDRIAYSSIDQNNDDVIMSMNAAGGGVAYHTHALNDGCFIVTPSWSPDGFKIAYIAFCSSTKYIVVFNLVNGYTSQTIPLNSSANYWGLDWSPKGDKFVFASNVDGDYEIFTMDVTGNSSTQLTSNSSHDYQPAWSPDGNSIAFETTRDGNSEIYTMTAAGASPTRITNNAHADYNPRWSPDGTKLAFHSARQVDPLDTDIYTINTNGTSETLIYGNGISQGATMADWQPTGATPNVYRFWSPSYLHHFYTGSYDEAAHVIRNYPDSIWTYEGIAYKARSATNCGAKSPVYRFWSNLYKGHFYTISNEEKQYVIDAYDDNTWGYEGIAFCADTTQVAGTKPLYRFWSNLYKGHFYTTSEQEKQYVIDAYDDNVWLYESIAYYVE